MVKFYRQSIRTFHCLSDFRIKIEKIMRPTVALGLTLNTILSRASLTVLNPDFTEVI